MIENTLGSLAGLAGFTWVGVQFLKNIFKSAPQELLALVIGMGSTLAFWKAGVVTLDGADPATWEGWMVAAIYGFFAVAVSAKSHELGQNPSKLVKRIQNGKVAR